MSKNGAVENGKPEQMARGLGWFSIGLGLAGVIAPRAMAKLIGVKDHPLLFRLLGLRESSAKSEDHAQDFDLHAANLRQISVALKVLARFAAPGLPRVHRGSSAYTDAAPRSDRRDGSSNHRL